MKSSRPTKDRDTAAKESVIKSALRYINEGEIHYYLTPIVGTVLLFILGQIITPGFLSVNSVFNYMAIASLTVFACLAQTLIMISGDGGIDLSVGALMSLGAAWGAALSGGTTVGVIWSVLLMAGIGALCGLISGTSVKVLVMPAMVVTLSVGNFVNGGYLAITRGQPAGTQAELFKIIGTGDVFGYFRWILLIAIVLIIVIELILRKTRYGKSLYLVGTNERAAALSGIRTTRIVVLTYMIAGVASALAGLMLFSVVGATQAGLGDQYTMLSIASAVIGGVYLGGGKGTYLGAALGALMMTVLTGVLTVVQIPDGARNCIKGMILLAILLVYARSPKLRQ